MTAPNSFPRWNWSGADQVADQSGKTKRKSAPVSSHRLFPAIVALWFAALFGLGSLAIRPTLIESFVLAAHIDTLVPAAAPPLGVTARILLALVLAVLGGLAGAAIAKRITRPKVELRERKRGAAALNDGGTADVKRRTRDTHPDAPARRPISAHDEIGGIQIEPAAPGAAVLPGRRRSLAIRDEGANSDFHDFAPLPGGSSHFHDPQVLDLAEIDLGAFEEIAPSIDDYPASGDAVAALPAEPRQMFGQPANFAVEPYNVEPFDAESFAAVPVDAVDAAPIADFAAPTAEFAAPALPIMPHADIAVPSGIAAEQIAAASLGSLGLAALTERFALSLQRRREAAELAVAAAIPDEAEPIAEMSEPILAAPSFARMGSPEPVAPAEPAAAAPMAMPASLRPLNFDDPGDDDADDFSSFLPLRRISMPVAPIEDEPVEQAFAPTSVEEPEAEDALEPEIASETDIDEDDGYSSLLGLSRPTPPRQQFIRIDEPEAESAEIEPVVIFPGQAARGATPAGPFSAPIEAAAAAAPSEVTALRRFDAPASAVAGQPVAASAPAAPAQDAEQTERALRAALATLQRMSGAA